MFDLDTGTIIIWVVMMMFISVIYMMLMPQMMGLQSRFMIRQIRKAVGELEGWAKNSREIALRKITKYGRPRRDVAKELDNSLEFFAIAPVSDDPAGVLHRLEHVLDVRKKRFEDIVKRLAPKSDSETAANLEMTLEGAMASHLIYKIVRHLMLFAEKTRSTQLVMLIQMQLPILKEYAKAYLNATQAFARGKSIGDGAGALVAAKLAGDGKWHESTNDTVYTETELDGRKVFVVKAKGPGGRVGKPGELIKKLIKRRKVSRIIMIDAALKLEGEQSGEIVEGVGAAIGGPPTEKYKIEQITTKKGIPVDALIIKEAFKEAITPLNSRIAKAVDATVEKAKESIRKHTKKGDTVIIGGIGNTIGIGQISDQIPKKFPRPSREEGLESDKFLFGPG
ncbi:MAG: DUF1512 domain-containing protein [Candidatus Hadarchaeota archaeon]|nr:DUF1512 domain-containing protein [Candidatus Hadarchaeota archaeon]